MNENDSAVHLVRLEVPVDHPQAVLAAARGGAERLELCASLADGGLTPSMGLIAWTLAAVSIPVHCMVRPRGGNFVYHPQELEVIVRDIESMRDAGVHGIVTGVLTPERTVNVDAMRRLVAAAHPKRVCFHRAFDLTADHEQALEDVIRCGAAILLTSGGAANLAAGAAQVERIARQAAGRIEIMGGAGVNIGNAGQLWRDLPIDTLHASLRTPWADGSHAGSNAASIGSRDADALHTVREQDVRDVLSLLEPRAVPAL